MKRLYIVIIVGLALLSIYNFYYYRHIVEAELQINTASIHNSQVREEWCIRTYKDGHTSRTFLGSFTLRGNAYLENINIINCKLN